ncbi:MAG: SDR family oxidoreductase [bacterium]|nr:SDR family oxidoreductase [bacterium]MDE0290357.1 SDR family oxidoreductase [bacterium]MDE0438551.1 SDR family oxidoreductase [bacterium]
MALPTISELVSLEGKCAVVTGAAQGFGAAISRRLGEAGATVFVADRNVEGAEQSAERLRGLGCDAIAHSVDIADRGRVEALVEAAVERAGRVDILVNNAGIYSNYYFSNMPPKEFADTVSVNVVGTFQMSQAVTQRMMADQQGGSIVNIASVDAFNTSAEGLAHYTTSKHAIGGMTKSMAIELAAHNIRVNAVCPGAAMTEGAIALVTAGAPEGIDVEAQWDGIKERTPLRRLCDPDDVARAVLFLASDMAAFVTGAFLVVDGGILVQPLEGYVPAAGH